ncbi:hypothetical protein HKD37_01G001087 [Glycine soja]
MNGHMHTVVYNKDLVNPTIVSGWTTMRNFYGLNGDHQVMLTHYGQSVFLLTIFKSSSNPKSFPKWHALYHNVPNSVTFKVLLNQYKVTCNNLVIYSSIYLINSKAA